MLAEHWIEWVVLETDHGFHTAALAQGRRRRPPLCWPPARRAKPCMPIATFTACGRQNCNLYAAKAAGAAGGLRPLCALCRRKKKAARHFHAARGRRKAGRPHWGVCAACLLHAGKLPPLPAAAPLGPKGPARPRALGRPLARWWQMWYDKGKGRGAMPVPQQERRRTAQRRAGRKTGAIVWHNINWRSSARGTWAARWWRPRQTAAMGLRASFPTARRRRRWRWNSSMAARWRRQTARPPHRHSIFCWGEAADDGGPLAEIARCCASASKKARRSAWLAWRRGFRWRALPKWPALHAPLCALCPTRPAPLARA